MIISPRHALVFVHIPKTGGTSLALALEDRLGPEDYSIGDTPKAQKRRKRLTSVQTAGRLWKHSTLTDIAGIVPDAELTAMRVFTIVRNPWDRMVSYYYWLKAQSFDHPAVTLAKTHEFSAFLHHPQTQNSFRNAPYASYVTRADGTEQCALFLRFENLEADLEHLSMILGLKLGPLTHANPSDRGPYRDAYSRADRKLVAEIAAQDIARFGYRF